MVVTKRSGNSYPFVEVKIYGFMGEIGGRVLRKLDFELRASHIRFSKK